MIKKAVGIAQAQLYFDEELPYNVSRVSESYSLQLHEHEFTEICYVAEGSGFHYIGEESLSVSPGDMFVLPLGTSHVFRPRSTDPDVQLVVYNFIFIADRVAKALKQFPGLEDLTRALHLLNMVPGHPDWKKIHDSSGIFRSLLDQAYKEFNQRKIGFIPRMHCLFIVLATEIERHLTELETNYSMNKDGLLRDAIAFIHKNFVTSITADQAASEAGLSVRHFHRMFAIEMGYTFVQYIQNLRIERSCDLLRTTRLSVSEIAEEVGYQDKGFFVKLFKKRTGHTPRSYRNV
ncbi:AraC family transcriptional regulator [Paenibacillus sp. HWE-109]|uniref:AraC family transcriptional regulator n=1 Tax=Paenibacillus sp. HWE-109 TaxID=1306526 RepID=UPI001EDF9CC1|nr:AraC family transcriptional regulator [Paenibacillus sp. HWE-109]UKS28309.1 AraC family transcriptional regulator [Paenibacillus sp. HWE-109]